VSLRHTLLGILDWVPMHGYALREVTRSYAWIQPMANVNIYPTLRDLETAGLVRHVEEVHDGRLRKIYSITDAGRTELVRWLADPELEPVVYRDLALLKIALLRPEAQPGASAWIEAELERNAKLLEEAERWLREDDGRAPRYSRLVAEYGREVQAVRVRWLERVLGEARREVHAGRE
jgi:DNA-binding PadR family transcriptional regulator